MTFLVSIDPGTKNIGVSYFHKKYLGSQLLTLTYEEFKDWFHSTFHKLQSLTVVVENQRPDSRHKRICHFLEGYCYARGFTFHLTTLRFGRHLSYKERKKMSVDLFLQQQPHIPRQGKLDDIADSYHLGVKFLL